MVLNAACVFLEDGGGCGSLDPIKPLPFSHLGGSKPPGTPGALGAREGRGRVSASSDSESRRQEAGAGRQRSRTLPSTRREAGGLGGFADS